MKMAARRGIAWNLGGSILSTACQFVALPVLVTYLGAHGTGIIALAWLVTALSGCLEFGLSPALSSDLSRRTASENAEMPGRSLLRAFEIPCWAVALLIAGALVKVGPFIAEHWIQGGAGDAELSNCMRLMGINAGLSLVINLYVSALLGLGHQPAANAVRLTAALCQHIAGAVMVVLVGGGAFTWLITTAFGSLIAAGVGRVLVTSYLRRDSGIDWAGLWATGAFIRGMGLIGFLSVALGCLDRVLISPLLPLREFAAYALATMVGSGFRLVAGAVFGVVFPRLTALSTIGDEVGQRRLYLRTSRWLAVVFAPAVAAVSVAGGAVLLWWCRDPELAEHAAIVVGLLAMGSAINGLLSIPCALQLAYRRTVLTWASAASALVGMTVMILWLAPTWGSAGVALAWPLVHILVVAVVVPITHRYILPGLSQSWFIAIAGPIFASALVGLACAYIPFMRETVVGAVLVGLLCLIASGAVAWLQERRQ